MRKLLHEEIPRIQAESIHEHPRHPITVVVDNVRSIHNVGSFFRTGDGAWIERFILTGITGTPEHRALHKTALGAQDTIPWEHMLHTMDAVASLKEKGYRIAVLEITNTPTLAHELVLADFPLALVVGNELTGVTSEAIEMADYALEVPQYGTKQSLNVSVAFGVAVFDLVRHYRLLSKQSLLSDPFERPPHTD